MPDISMSSESSASVFPGRIRQFGFIIPDLDAAIAQWVDLGVAPWLVVPEIHMEGCWYRGERSDPVISIAFSNSGDMQIELIQQHDETPSIYREFLVATGGGFNQIAYWVEDVDAVRADAVAAGWSEVWRGDGSGQVQFSYLEHPTSPVPIVELSELNDATRSMGDTVRAAAAAWAPGQPILMG
jgi:Glyoxalase/Bleomycin resistance protein/Dioxygenase superfamily